MLYDRVSGMDGITDFLLVEINSLAGGQLEADQPRRFFRCYEIGLTAVYTANLQIWLQSSKWLS